MVSSPLPQDSLPTRNDKTKELFLQALKKQEAGDTQNAIALYRAAIALRPNLASLHCNLGVVLIQEERLEEALEAFRRAVLLRPELASGHNNLGNIYRLLSRFPEATAAYRKHSPAARIIRRRYVGWA